jgi:hypothetical protein
MKKSEPILKKKLRGWGKPEEGKPILRKFISG